MLDVLDATELPLISRGERFPSQFPGNSSITSSTGVPEITLYRDGDGGSWVRTYIPIGHEAANELRDLDKEGGIRLINAAPPEEDFRAVEMAWIQSHQAEIAAKFPGEWIAVSGAQLAAHARDLLSLLRLAAEAGHLNPFVTAVPAGPISSFHG